MNPDILLYVMAAAIVVSAAAIVIQSVLMVAMYRASRAMQTQLMSLTAKAGPLAESGHRLLEEVRGYAGDISNKTSELIALSHRQLDRVDEALAEATSRTRTQMDRIEMVLDDTINRFQETTSLLQDGILKPLRQLNAVTAGVRAALSILTGGRRTTVEKATHDEEMFI
jgi:ABC-type transporter Mla subunit MlaD